VRAGPGTPPIERVSRSGSAARTTTTTTGGRTDGRAAGRPGRAVAQLGTRNRPKARGRASRVATPPCQARSTCRAGRLGQAPRSAGMLGAASALADRSDFGSDAPHPHRPWWLVPTGYCACLCCAAPMSSPRRVGSVGRSASCVLPAPVLRPPSLHSPALLASSIPRPYHGARRTNANPSTCACTVQRPIYIRLSRPTYKSRDRSHACMP